MLASPACQICSPSGPCHDAVVWPPRLFGTTRNGASSRLRGHPRAIDGSTGPCSAGSRSPSSRSASDSPWTRSERSWQGSRLTGSPQGTTGVASPAPGTPESTSRSRSSNGSKRASPIASDAGACLWNGASWRTPETARRSEDPVRPDGSGKRRTLEERRNGRWLAPEPRHREGMAGGGAGIRVPDHRGEPMTS